MRSSGSTPLRPLGSARWLRIGAALGAALVLFLAQFAVFVGLGSPAQARGSDNRKAVKIDVTFTGNFVQDALASGETLPTDTNFASVAFATHESTVSYFNAGEAASAGLKAFAETGSTELLVEEFAAQTDDANVFPKRTEGTFPQGATTAQTFELHRASRGQDHLTFMASLSESPDWFVGARNIDLRPGGVWISELEVDLFAWDAGTDSGTDWDSADSATDPTASVSALKGVGKFSDEPIAKLTISMLPPPSNESRQRVMKADANSMDGALNVFWDAYPAPFKIVRSTLHMVEFDRYLVAWKSGEEEFQTDLDGNRVKVVMGRNANNTVIEGLTNGTEYTVRVTHANAVGPAADHSRTSTATPAARDGVLVSTFSQGLSHSNGVALNLITNLRGAKYTYNRFTTGPSAATLGSVTFARIQPSQYTSSRSAPKLELHLLEDLPGGEIGDSNFSQPGQPGALIGTFVSPPEYLDGPAKFVAPGDGFALSASTDYWLKLVLVQGGVTIPMTMIHGLDPDSQPGWDIADGCQWSLFDIWHTRHVKMCSYYSNFMVSLNSPISSTVPLASISGGSAIEGESIEFTVELSSAPSTQATIQYDTVDGSTPLAATTADNDYTAVSGGTVTFEQGETSKTVSIATGDDSTDENNERFIVRLSSPSPNIALSEIDSAAGMIIDDDQTASSDSTLAGITLTDQDGNTIALNETFDPLRFVYTADAGASVESMHLSISFAEGINPGHIRYFDKFGKVAEGKKSQASSAEFTRIMPGVNLLKALITSKDHRRESLYKVMVSKAASSDASIATLVLEDNNFNKLVLSPAFSPSVTEYTATAENNPPFYIDVGLNHSGADAEVSVNGEVVVPYSFTYPYGTFGMPAGDSTLAIEVTAEDGTIQTYTFTVEREGGDEPVEPPPPNQAATGLPTIAGTPQVGSTLSADTTAIGDANGLANGQFTYQWIRNDGNSDTNIPGATGQTHTLTQDDQGKTIKVSVSFTDDDGYPETLISSATAAVAAIPVEPVEPVEPVDPVDPVEPLWSGEMTVADYGNASLGAYNDDTLFSNVMGTAQLEIESLWYFAPQRKLYLAFKAPVAGARDWTLHIDELALSFPSGDSNFVFRNVDVSWTAGQVVNAKITR